MTATKYLSASQLDTVDLLCLVERVLYWLYCLYCEHNSVHSKGSLLMSLNEYL